MADERSPQGAHEFEPTNPSLRNLLAYTRALLSNQVPGLHANSPGVVGSSNVFESEPGAEHNHALVVMLTDDTGNQYGLSIGRDDEEDFTSIEWFGGSPHARSRLFVAGDSPNPIYVNVVRGMIIFAPPEHPDHQARTTLVHPEPGVGIEVLLEDTSDAGTAYLVSHMAGARVPELRDEATTAIQEASANGTSLEHYNTASEGITAIHAQGLRHVEEGLLRWLNLFSDVSGAQSYQAWTIAQQQPPEQP